MFLGMNFSILGVLGVEKFCKNFFLCLFFVVIQNNLKVFGSAHVNVGQPCSSSNKVQPKLFSGRVNI